MGRGGVATAPHSTSGARPSVGARIVSVAGSAVPWYRDSAWHGSILRPDAYNSSKSGHEVADRIHAGGGRPDARLHGQGWREAPWDTGPTAWDSTPRSCSPTRPSPRSCASADSTGSGSPLARPRSPRCAEGDRAPFARPRAPRARRAVEGYLLLPAKDGRAWGETCVHHFGSRGPREEGKWLESLCPSRTRISAE